MAEIRKAAERDVLPVAAIYEHIISEEEAGRVCIGWQRGVYPTEHTAREAIAAGELFVMADGGEIVAAARINRTQVPEYADAQWEYTALDDEIMVLHTLVVSPACAGRGALCARKRLPVSAHGYEREEHGRAAAVCAPRL